MLEKYFRLWLVRLDLCFFFYVLFFKIFFVWFFFFVLFFILYFLFCLVFWGWLLFCDFCFCVFWCFYWVRFFVFWRIKVGFGIKLFFIVFLLDFLEFFLFLLFLIFGRCFKILGIVKGFICESLLVELALFVLTLIVS